MSDDAVFSSTGMKISEAVRRAEQWWTLNGRHLMSKQLNQASNVEEHGRKYMPSNGKSAALLIRGALEPVIPSGILRGLPWSELTATEQQSVVRTWHDNYIASPLHGLAQQQSTIKLDS